MDKQRQTDLNPLASTEFEPVLDLMRRVVHRRNPQASTFTRKDLAEVLRFARPPAGAVREQLTSILGELPDLAEPSEFQALYSSDAHRTLSKLRLSAEMAEVFADLTDRFSCFLQLPDPLPVPKCSKLRGQLNELSNLGIPGQESASREAALDLLLQLDENTRSTPARLLLHGPEGCGTREMAKALAARLQRQGHDLLEVECSQYRSEGEAASWVGAKSYWSGSRPGIITEQIYNHPRSVVIFHDIDRTLPGVMESIRSALQQGYLIDDFGLEEQSDGDELSWRQRESKRRPTRVECAQAIFIFTAAAGGHWYRHPEHRSLLNDPEQARITMTRAMYEATRQHRGETTSCFDHVVLAEIDRHLVLLGPLQWNVLVDEVSRTLTELSQRYTEGYNCTLSLDPALSEVYLLNQARNDLGVRDLRLVEQRLLRSALDTLLYTEQAIDQITLRLDDAATQRLATLQGRLGAMPIETLQRKQQRLAFTEHLVHEGESLTIWVEAPRLERAPRFDDYNGQVRITAEVPEVDFSMVAGHANVKHSMKRIIGYLHAPEPLSELTIELPRGLLLDGPPGTGKTLLAKAFAGEAELPFIAVSGTDLLNPERTQELYRLAHNNAPCAVFIDEADALGTRGRYGAVHDAAINKLLTEIQGFNSSAPIFHILATNRSEEIDPALTRPGRIDQHFAIGTLDDPEARLPMLERLARVAELPPQEAAETLLGHSCGMTGAQLEQAIRETGLLRIEREQQGMKGVTLADAIDQLRTARYGKRTDSPASSPELLRRVAIHEAGHAIVHTLLLPGHRVQTLSADARGNSSGFLHVTVAPGQDNRSLTHVKHRLTALMAGRAAEKLLYNSPSSGDCHDIASATEIAFKAIAHEGLDEQFGPISLAAMSESQVAPDLIQAAWDRVRSWIDEADANAMALLQEQRVALERLADELAVRATLNGSEVESLINTYRTWQ